MERFKLTPQLSTRAWESGLITGEPCLLTLTKNAILVSLILKGEDVIYEILFSRIKSADLKNHFGNTEIINGYRKVRLIVSGKEAHDNYNMQKNLNLTNEHEEIYTIETKDSSLFDKRVWASWSSYVMRRSADLCRNKNKPSISLTEAYYAEVIADLKVSKTVEDTTEIFDDFSKEVLMDFELKELCFRSREFFLRGFLVCHKALSSSAGLSRYSSSNRGRDGLFSVGDGDQQSSVVVDDDYGTESDMWSKKSRPGGGASNASCRSMIYNSKLAQRFIPTDVTDSELHTLLQEIVLERLKLIRSVLCAFSSILFDSETIDGRIGLVTGPVPLDYDSWMSLLVCDVYAQLCKRVGCPPAPEHAIIANELNASIATLRSSWGARARLTEGPDRMSFDDIVLTPLKKKMLKRDEHTSYTMPELSHVQRSVIDLQTLIVFELARVTTLYGPGQTNVPHAPARSQSAFGISDQHHGRDRARIAKLVAEHERGSAGRVIISTGVSWTRQTDWEIILENLVVRLSELLDDFIASDHVISHLSAGELAAASRLRRSHEPLREYEDEEEYDSFQASSSTEYGTPHRVPEVRTSRTRSSSPAVASGRKSSSGTPRSSGVRVSVSPSPVSNRRSVRGSAGRGRRGLLAQSEAQTAGKRPNEYTKYFSSLETQEILLHVTAQLLYFLALDSAEIRIALANDLGVYWVSIMTVFNLIVPRPERKSPAAPGSKPAADDRLSNPVPGTISEPATVIVAAPQTRASRLGSVSGGLRSLFQGFSFRRQNRQEQQPEQDFPLTAEPQTIALPNSVASAARTMGLPDAGTEAFVLTSKANKRNTVELALSVTDYGPPRFGLSSASWTLLILARQAVEKIIGLINLDEAVPFYPAGRMEQDAQKLRDIQAEEATAARERKRRARRERSAPKPEPTHISTDAVESSAFVIKRMNSAHGYEHEELGIAEALGSPIGARDLSSLLEESARELPRMSRAISPRLLAADTNNNIDGINTNRDTGALPGLKRVASPSI